MTGSAEDRDARADLGPGDENASEAESRESASKDIKSVIRKIMSDHSEDVIIFDKREAGALQEIARIYLGLKTVGSVAVALTSIIKYVGFFAALYIAYKSKIFPDFSSGMPK